MLRFGIFPFACPEVFLPWVKGWQQPCLRLNRLDADGFLPQKAAKAASSGHQKSLCVATCHAPGGTAHPNEGRMQKKAAGNGRGGNWHIRSTCVGGDGHHLAAGTLPGRPPAQRSKRWRSRTRQRAMVPAARESRRSALPTLGEAMPGPEAGPCARVPSPAELPGLLWVPRLLLRIPVHRRLLGTGAADGFVLGAQTPPADSGAPEAPQHRRCVIVGTDTNCAPESQHGSRLPRSFWERLQTEGGL